MFKPRMHILTAFAHRIHNSARKVSKHVAKAKAVAKEQGNSYDYDWAEQCKHYWMEAERQMDATPDQFPILP